MTLRVGDQIQTSPPFFGEWNPAPTGYTFQWQDSTNGTTLNGNLSGETRSDYIVADDETGMWIRVQVTAFNAVGSSDPAVSGWVGPVEEALERASGSRKRDRRTGGGSKPHGRVRRTV